MREPRTNALCVLTAKREGKLVFVRCGVKPDWWTEANGVWMSIREAENYLRYGKLTVPEAEPNRMDASDFMTRHVTIDGEYTVVEDIQAALCSPYRDTSGDIS